MTEKRRIFPSRREQKLLYDLTALKLWYAFDLAAAGRLDFEAALLSQTTFYGQLPWFLAPPAKDTPPEKQPLWRGLVERLLPIQAAHAADRRPGAFCREAAEIVFPLALTADVRHRMTNREEWFGCFRYDYVPETRLLRLHFKNAYVPDSPFADPARLFRTLAEMVRALESRGAAPETVTCGSWIHHLRPFQALFPASYLASLAPTSPDSKTGDGWWGQFTSRHGSLHLRRARILKREGRFEFDRLSGRCPYRDYREHIMAHQLG